MTEPKNREEAKDFIETLAEQKLSMMDMFGIVKENSTKNLKKLNPKCHLLVKRIYDEDIFKKLRDKLEEKKKETGYNTADGNPETDKMINQLESALYKANKIPLYEIGLTENLKEGFDWLIDEMLLSYASFSNTENEGRNASRKLYPAEKSYDTSKEAEEFADFIECEKEDYKMFAEEFIRKLCGK